MSTSNSKRIIKKPGKTKAFFICLIIAAFFWLVHSLNTVYTQTFELEVSFKNMPKNKRALQNLPNKINVDVKASGLKLVLLRLKKPFHKMEIDFNEIKSIHRQQSFILSASKLNFYSVFNIETQVKNISPDTLQFAENSGVQKLVPVKVPMDIKCKRGFNISKLNIMPTYVTIWGDTNALKLIDTLYTESIFEENLDKGFIKKLKIINPAETFLMSENEVNLSAEINRLIEYNALIPIRVNNSSNFKKVSVFPSYTQIKFTALENNFSLKDTNLILVSLDLQNANLNNKKFPLQVISLPKNITLMELKPNEVEILIQK